METDDDVYEGDVPCTAGRMSKQRSQREGTRRLMFDAYWKMIEEEVLLYTRPGSHIQYWVGRPWVVARATTRGNPLLADHSSHREGTTSTRQMKLCGLKDGMELDLGLNRWYPGVLGDYLAGPNGTVGHLATDNARGWGPWIKLMVKLWYFHLPVIMCARDNN